MPAPQRAHRVRKDEKMRFLVTSTLAVGLALATSSAALAQTPALIEAFKDCAAYSVSGANGKVCYVASQP